MPADTPAKKRASRKKPDVNPTTAVAPPPEREIVVRIRRRRTRPDWTVARVLGWSVTAVLGDPGMLLIPLGLVSLLILAALGVGAPGKPEALVPILVVPPGDSFQDIGAISLANHGGAAVWLARIAFAVFRAGAFALLCGLAIMRARGYRAEAGEALREAGRRWRMLAVLGAVSFGFALLVSQSATLDATRDAGSAGTALLVGMLFLPGAFVAAMDDRIGPVRALARSALWIRRKPLGYLLLVAAYGATLNGLYQLATFGETSKPRALPLTLYALAGGLVTMIFVAAVARRQILLAERPPKSAETKD